MKGKRMVTKKSDTINGLKFNVKAYDGLSVEESFYEEFPELVDDNFGKVFSIYYNGLYEIISDELATLNAENICLAYSHYEFCFEVEYTFKKPINRRNLTKTILAELQNTIQKYLQTATKANISQEASMLIA